MESVEISLDPPLRDDVADLALRAGIPPFVVLESAWQIALRKLTAGGAVLLVLGLPCDGIGASSAETDLCPVEIPDDDEADFERTCREVLRSGRGSDVPLTRREPGLSGGGPSGRGGSFLYGFSTGATPPPGAGLRATLVCRERADSAVLTLFYDGHALSDADARRMLDRYLGLLREALDHPGRPVGELGILLHGEGDILLREWSGGEKAPEDAPQVHMLIEEQAVRTPDAVALSFGEGCLTYREMNARGNRMARALRALGAGPGAIVAIAMERSSEMAVAMLAVLKSGSAYLPMDPAFPEGRLAFQMGDARASVLVTDSDRVAAIAPPGTRVLFPAREGERLGTESEGNLAPAGISDDLALVMYTSGSTGSPKGVMISRRAMANMIRSVALPLEITGDDVCLHSASVTFILSVRQLFVPLMRGATVVIAPSATVRDPAAYFNLLGQRRVTVIDLVPSFWRVCTQWLASLGEEKRAPIIGALCLRQIVTVGEPLHEEVVRGWWSVCGTGARIFNIYGQTETTGPVTIDLVSPGVPAGTPLVGIGRPIPSMRVFLFDGRRNPVPPGVPGELYVAGPDLSDGYLNLPSLTREKFIDGAAVGNFAGKMFRTGDVGRLLPDGRIEFVGRSDFQVKIRGFRIEPGEIEALLNSHPSVRESVVAGREDQHGQNRLIAYVVLRANEPAAMKGIRESLAARLPEYMVPSIFVPLRSLPRMPNGKLNRRALPDPSPSGGFRMYAPSWMRGTLPFRSQSALAPEQRILLFCDRGGVGDEFARLVRSAGGNALLVRKGSAFTALNETEFVIDPASRADHEALFDHLSSRGEFPETIVHLWFLEGDDPVPNKSLGRYHGIVSFARALGGKVGHRPERLCVVTRGAVDVTGTEMLEPDAATVLGACLVIPIEFPAVECKCVDLDSSDRTRDGGGEADFLLREMAGPWGKSRVAYRSGNRWIPAMEQIPSQGPGREISGLRNGGVYLVTGGFGGIGLVLTKKIAEAVHARLVLVGRSGFPPREDWDEWTRSHAPDDPLSAKIRTLRAVLGAGSEIMTARADVADLGAMQAVVDEARGRFGRINGVIHTAGVPGSGMILHATESKSDPVISPKVRGTHVLESVLAGEELDFMVLCSSLASIQGRAGLVDYCAANAFLDLYARKRNRTGRLTIAVNWDTWDCVGMDAAYRRENPDFNRLSRGTEFRRLTPGDGGDAFLEVLSLRLPQVIVTPQTLVLNERDAEPDQCGRTHVTAVTGETRAVGSPAIPGGSSYVPPRTKGEEFIARLWEEHIGSGPVGVRDNFFALGGNSLMAVQMFITMEKHFGRSTPLATLLEAPTVEQLTARVSDQGWKPTWASLVPIQPLGKNPPLFCAHGGGGNVLSFEALARHLGPDQPLYGLQSVGLDGGTPYTRVEDMAAHYIRDILEFRPEGPYYLEGMSFGGLVALEMARMLTARGKDVALLALLDTYPKGYGKLAPRESLWRRIELRLSEFLALEGRDKRVFLRHRREEYAGKLSSLVKGVGGAAPPAGESQITRAVRTVREANLLASERYEPSPYPGRVTLFWARDSYLNATHRFRRGWDVLAPGRLEFHLVPGSHITMFEEPNVRVLAREIKRCIGRASRIVGEQV